jgi:Flp pilus assembly protein TadB
VLPFALPAAILAVSGGFLAWFGRLMPWVTAVAFIAVAVGWLWVMVQTVRSRRRPALSTLLTMSAATLLLVAALSCGHTLKD